MSLKLKDLEKVIKTAVPPPEVTAGVHMLLLTYRNGKQEIKPLFATDKEIGYIRVPEESEISALVCKEIKSHGALNGEAFYVVISDFMDLIAQTILQHYENHYGVKNED